MGAHPYQSSFTSGEVSDFLAARSDWQKYAQGARCMENWVVRTQGGISRRAGTIFLGPTKYSDRLAVLVRFEFSVEQAYVLEFGHEYIRVWANRDLLLVDGNGFFASNFFNASYFALGYFSAPGSTELTTPYQEADLRALRFEQSADVLYIAHQSYAPRKLRRITATEFQLDTINFLPKPSAEIPLEPSATLSLSATSGTAVTATASASSFLAGDVGRQILSGAGRGVITAVPSATTATLNVLDAFDSTGPIPAGEWSMDGSPNAATLTIDSITPNIITSITADMAAFRSTDVGKYVIREGSINKIVSFTSSTSVSAQVLGSESHDDATGTANLQWNPGTWTLEEDAWSDTLGWPGVVCLESQRLWWAGTEAYPDRIWGSVVADYENLGRGSLDDAGIEYQLGTSGVNLIRWLKGLKGLAVGTIADELQMRGGNDEPLTPSSVKVDEHTRHGADYDVDAIRAGNVVLFLQRGARRIREFAPADTVEPGFVANDLTVVAEHIFREGVVQMALATNPDQYLFAVTGDGQLAVLTYERQENVVGWSHHTTEGDFESVCVIPNNCGTGDEVWVIVNRSLEQGQYWHEDYWHTGYWASGYWADGGSVGRRYVEVFDGTVNTDCALVYEGTAASTFTGLDHLDGLDVKIITQDGDVFDDTVVDGSVSIDNPATEAEIGIHYTSTLQTLRPDVLTQAGTSMGRLRKWDYVSLLMFCTTGSIALDDEPLEYPEGNDDTEPYTGWLKRKMTSGWDEDAMLVIQTQEPKPATILGVTGSFQVADP